ncbi:cell division protein FtsI [Carbonactinospora thermoautotrophica]|uniref:Cell division protein FtsI n=1 Tax=Carbonactinospora thermoautotrophica TaxID=1469144 RepID=A0A132NF56_9ACTN|nr:penicillin-binding transpeptidase domain-containing protein [Carbonactinospora thermoautotrophica]KWW97876.1 cell division protein FtsI [Carbonactinospora thermoautotrophica]KWX08745.1 cell division protein FtsI [Carbonactinospora thermoautotrophica]
MNRSIRRSALMCGLLFFALLLNANYVQFLNAGKYRDSQYNPRRLIEEYDRERGEILVAGTPVAKSKPTGGKYNYQRVYPQGPKYAPITGYYAITGSARGIENVENSILNGTDDSLFASRIVDLFSGKPARGGSVLLTIDPKAQDAAWKALRGKEGAIVALDPQTGAVLAMASSPSYDPNDLASHNPGDVQKAYNKLIKDPDKPMLNRALQETYPPGSTFKVVTAAAALASGKFSTGSRLYAAPTLDLPKTNKSLPNEYHRACPDGGGDGRTGFEKALEVSCNTAFGSVGLELGEGVLRQYAERFGFNSDPKLLGSAESVFPRDLDEPFLAYSAIGQYDVRATPLQMAMVAAGIANGGKVMKPYLVQEVRGPDLSTLSRTKPKVLSEAVPPEVAATVAGWMVNVVENGTGRKARIPGVQVAGKTGTAQQGKNDLPLAWFISFAPAQNPKVAVAVVIENGSSDRSEIGGGSLAAPLAKQVMEAVLDQ